MAANDRVGNVYLDVLPRGEGFNKGVQSIIDKAEKDAKFAVGANTKQAEADVNRLANNITDNVGGAWITAAAQAAAFTGAVFAARRAVEGVVAKFSDLFDGLAKARAGFNALLGEKSGENLLSQVRQFAIDSPFVTQELVQYSQQLLGVGKAASTVVPTLKSVGDIVASVGGDTSNLGSILYALTQIQTIGKLTGQDARQLQNQLVPITKYISEYTGKSVADVKKLQEAGGISSDIVFAAIQNQGKRVEGALNNSVRNISGAKSVLADTVKNFYQSSPALNKINEDLVKGIQTFAAFLSKPEVKKYIDDFFDSIGHLYEGLKPLGEQLISLGGSGGLTALGAFTRTLNTLATVLEIIPEPVLKLIATSLGTLAALKAPLALIQYATNIQRITSGLLGGGGLVNGLTRASTALGTTTQATNEAALAANRLAQSYSQLPAEMVAIAEEGKLLAASMDNIAAKQSILGRLKTSKGLQQGGALAAGVAGSLLQANSAPTNVGAQAAGGALTYGAIGLSVGGPLGAAVGGAFGAITSYLDASDARLEAQIEKNRAVGRKAAEAYLSENEKLFASASGVALDKAAADLRTLQTQRAIEASKSFDDDGNVVTDVLSLGQYGTSGGDKKKAALAAIDEQVRIQKEAADKLTQPVIDAVQAADKAGVGSQFYESLFTPTGGVHPSVIKSFADLDVAFREYGVTASEVAAMGASAFVELVTKINGLDTAQKNAVVSANLLQEAIKNATGDSTAIYGAQISNITNQIGVLNSLEAAKKSGAAQASTSGAAGQVAALTAAKDLLAAQSDARARAVADANIATEEAILKAKKDGNDALAAELKLNKDKVATDAGVAAEQRVLNDVLTSNTQAIYANVAAKRIALDVAARTKIATDLELAQNRVSTTQAAAQASLTAQTQPANQLAQIAARKALFDAQEAAGNEAAAKASEQDRKLLSLLADKDSAYAKDLQLKITTEEFTAKQAAREEVLNKIVLDGALALGYYNQAQEIANKQKEKAVNLTELQNRATALSNTTAATAARITSAQRPGDQSLRTAAQIATAQAVQAAGDEAAFRATEKLVKERDLLLQNGYQTTDLNVQALTAQIQYTDEVARTAAATKTLAAIEKDAAVSRINYNYQTSVFLENLTKAQTILQALYGDEIAKANALQGFATTIDSAAQSAADFATATSAKKVPGDIFSGVITASQIATLNVSALTAKQSAANAALAYGATAAYAAAQGLQAYNEVMDASLINVEAISTQVLANNAALKSVPEGATAVTSIIQRDIQIALSAKQAADRAIEELNANATGFSSPEQIAALAKAKADSAKNQHILDILEGKTGDDLGIYGSISAGAQASVQPAIDAAAKAAADEAARKAKEAADAIEKWQETIQSATESLTTKLESAANNIASAADRWVGSIKERTQYESAVSVNRLTRNAGQQTKDIAEITAGLANLRSRGVSEDVLKALGIDSVADTRQLRKLVKSSDSDLAKLTGAVVNRSAAALGIATSEQDAAQRKNITQAIIDAAKALDFKTTKEEAAGIAASINITSGSSAEDTAKAILSLLSGGKIG